MYHCERAGNAYPSLVQHNNVIIVYNGVDPVCHSDHGDILKVWPGDNGLNSGIGMGIHRRGGLKRRERETSISLNAPAAAHRHYLIEENDLRLS